MIRCILAGYGLAAVAAFAAGHSLGWFAALLVIWLGGAVLGMMIALLACSFDDDNLRARKAQLTDSGGKSVASRSPTLGEG